MMENEPMAACKHRNLLLLEPAKDRVRCRHCHLTIQRNELRTRYCPECYETVGIKRFDFDEVVASESGPVRYRCEDCNLTWVC